MFRRLISWWGFEHNHNVKFKRTDGSIAFTGLIVLLNTRGHFRRSGVHTYHWGKFGTLGIWRLLGAFAAWGPRLFSRCLGTNSSFVPTHSGYYQLRLDPSWTGSESQSSGSKVQSSTDCVMANPSDATVLYWTGLFLIALFGSFGNCVNDARRQFCL